MAAKKDDAGDEDLDGLQLAINEKSDETLECTRRMREMCAEAKDSGMKTLIALDDQEELIDKFEAAADGINADMALAEKALKVVLRLVEFEDFDDQTAASSTIARLLMLSSSRFCFRFLPPPLRHHSSKRGHHSASTLPSNPSFCTFEVYSIFEREPINKLSSLHNLLIAETIKGVFDFYFVRHAFILRMLTGFSTLNFIDFYFVLLTN